MQTQLCRTRSQRKVKKPEALRGTRQVSEVLLAQRVGAFWGITAGQRLAGLILGRQEVTGSNPVRSTAKALVRGPFSLPQDGSPVPPKLLSQLWPVTRRHPLAQTREKGWSGVAGSREEFDQGVVFGSTDDQDLQKARDHPRPRFDSRPVIPMDLPSDRSEAARRRMG
jgi:hypothetical protein